MNKFDKPILEAVSRIAQLDESPLPQEEVKAAILLGSKGVDLPRIQQQLQSLASAHAAAAQSGALAGPLEPIRLVRMQLANW